LHEALSKLYVVRESCVGQQYKREDVFCFPGNNFIFLSRCAAKFLNQNFSTDACFKKSKNPNATQCYFILFCVLRISITVVLRHSYISW